jgi:iron complex outermembrane receptor protein/vitamin B12 transporter
LFVRGGNANFNKILIDGMAVNEIGGAIYLSALSTAGTESVEVLRTPNSVLYGSDAMSGVVSLTTRRGRYRVPEATYSIDGGNMSTFRQAASVGGAVKRFDYFSELAHFKTDNDVPNNDYRNVTYAGRFGVVAGRNTTVSGTLRWFDTAYGDAYQFNYFLVPDDSRWDNRSTVATVTAQSQWSDRLRTTARYGIWSQDQYFINPTPTGEPSDPLGEGLNYVGETVTIHGANGYSTTGRAILDFGGEYPFAGTGTMRRHTLSGQGDYDITSTIQLSGGGRIEQERGTPDVFSVPEKKRKNGGAFIEGRFAARDRVHVTAGVGIEHNSVFGNAATPKISVGWFIRQPSSISKLAETKVTFNAGKGIKAPNLIVEQSALASLIPPDSPLAASIPPIGPERSRSTDVGVEQGLWRGRARARVSYFHNEFSDMIEGVNRTVLIELGVPPDVANAVRGAAVNAASYTAQGIEASLEAVMGAVRIVGSYMFLDGEVTKSFSRGVYNPAFPDVPIGVVGPLDGGRPFRRPSHSGSFVVAYTRDRAYVGLSGYFSGKRDNSTYLIDEFGENSMLLPNHNLLAGYQKVDLSGRYRIRRNLRCYLSMENLLNQKYEAEAGFPALPAAVRTGVTVDFGGAPKTTP